MVTAASEWSSSRAPVVGREDVLAELSRVLAGAQGGTGQALLLRGPAGIGKSHLLRATVERARAMGFHVLEGRALPEDLPPPFTLVRNLLESADRGDGAPAADEGEKDALIPIYLLPFLGSESSNVTPAPTPARAGVSSTEEMILRLGPPDAGGAGQGHQELAIRVADFLREATRSAPLLIAIDDLQFADPSSLEALQQLTSDLAKVPLALVATLSDPLPSPERPRHLLTELTGASTFRSVALRPFNPPEVKQFVVWIQGGRAVPEQDVLRWHAQTEGNPLFLEQVVRMTMGYGVSEEERAPGGRDVAEVLRHRIVALRDPERRLLTYAVVLGKEFAFADLLAVAGVPEEEGTESLDRLVREGLIRERGGEVYEFVSEAVRNELYTELTETRRRILHQKAGRALELRGAGDSELARHYYLGREDEKAVEYNTRAAQAAARAFDYDTAASHLSRALEAERRRPDRTVETELQLHIDLGRLLDELGNLRRSDSLLTEAVQLARDHPGHELALGRALLAHAQTRADLSEYASSSGLAVEAVGILAIVGSARDLMAAHRVLGTVNWRLGRLDEAEAHQREALDIARREGTPSEVGHTLIDLANSMMGGGQELLAPALELYGQAADLFGAQEDHAARARVLMNRAVLYYSAGHEADARKDLAVAIESAERSRSPIWIGYCYLNLAQIEAEAGDVTAARHALDRAVEAVGSLGDRLAWQQLAMTRGMVAEAEHAFEDADLHYTQALVQARSLGMGAEETEVLARMAHAAHLRGDDTTARTLLADARSRGILDHRPDLAERVHALEAELGPPPDPQR